VGGRNRIGKHVGNYVRGKRGGRNGGVEKDRRGGRSEVLIPTYFPQLEYWLGKGLGLVI
jgi:hypothetical protein